MQLPEKICSVADCYFRERDSNGEMVTKLGQNPLLVIVLMNIGLSRTNTLKETKLRGRPLLAVEVNG